MATTLDDRIRQATCHVAGQLKRQPLETFFATASESQRGVTSNLAPPDQSVNTDVIALACALLSVADDVQTFVLDEELLHRFDLMAAYGIDPQPLFHLNAYDHSLRRTIKALSAVNDEPLESRYPQICDALHDILTERLLGAQTSGKMAYVKSITEEGLSRLTSSAVAERMASLAGIAEPIRRVESRQVARQVITLHRTTINLLERQWQRLPTGHVNRKPIEGMLQRLRRQVSAEDMLRFQLRALSADDPRAAIGFDDFCRDYCDEIVQLIASHAKESEAIPVEPSWRCVRGSGIELAYVTRNVDFLLLGDRYGDCTARRTSKQVDVGIPNIHWTIYSWLLDPFYRILQVHVDGEGVLKAHLTPLILGDEPVLAVDAIEVVPALRDTLRNGGPDRRAERPHKYLSSRLFGLRREILAALFETVLGIGRRMGVAAILVDKYSNAAWVRNEVDALPEEYYHVASLTKPFGLSPLIQLSLDWLGESPVAPRMEIQGVNLLLMDQGLREGYKHAGLLWGRPRTGRLPIRGP